MEAAHLKELITLEQGYWWHVAKRRLATQLLLEQVPLIDSIATDLCAADLQPLVIEGGIGAGGNLLHWQSCGYRVSGLDIMPESIENATARGLTNVHVHDLHEPWPYQPGCASAVVLLDVLEHLRDPVLALQRAREVLATDGKIIFTVPAHPWLYSDWDHRLGHYRRYTARMLTTQVQAAGFKLSQMRPWNAISLPIAVALRLYRRMIPHPRGAEFPRIGRLMNQALLSVQSLEQRMANYCIIPCGLSILGVMSK